MFDTIIKGIVAHFVNGWVQGQVKAGTINPSQAKELTDGIMVELQIGLELYAKAQQAQQAASSPN